MRDLKIRKDGFDIEIVDVFQEGDVLRVKTRCPFGEDDIGLSYKEKYLDKDGIPKWKRSVKYSLEKKYGRFQSEREREVVDKDFRGVLNVKDLDKKNPKFQK